MKDYPAFLHEKIAISDYKGFDIHQSEIHHMLKPHQKDSVQLALKGGCRALFEAFGLGKTIISLEIARLVGKHKGGLQLIVAPLGVIQEFKVDAGKLGIEIRFVRWTKDLTGPGIYITNYESVRDGRLDVNRFNLVHLDEASCLRSYGSKTFQEFLTLFPSVPFKTVATATPAPNRFKELIHYAGYLGIMDTGAALTRFFKRDSTKANNLTINPHMEKEFWLWVSSWALFLQRPSDLGYSDEGYDLPPLKVIYHEVPAADVDRIDKKDGQRLMFGDASLSAIAAAHEKRSTIEARINKMMEIINNDPGSHYILWHDQEAERHAIKKALPSAVEVYGSQDLEVREQRIMDFSNGKIQYLATKPILSGSGCNFQRHCHKAIFLGIGFKFNDWIQALHRIYRFLQTNECEIHLIYASSEVSILETLKKKWANHNKMVGKMTELIKKYGLSNAEMMKVLQRSMGVERIEVAGDDYLLANNDCVDEVKRIKTDSMGMILTSIPFSNHYEYTPSYNDLGFTRNNEHFWQHMDYLTPELLRVLQPGRIYACHTKDRILFGNVTGKGLPTVSPFHMEATFHAMKHGFDYLGMITVVTDVVRENNQTYRLGWTEQCKDGSKMGVGSPEYILLFHKPQTDRGRGYADEPVFKEKEEYSRARWQVDAHAFWRSSGDRLLMPEELKAMPMDTFLSLFKEYDMGGIYYYETHVKIGESMDVSGRLPSTFMSIAPNSHHPDVWTDINRMLTLNGSQAKRKQSLHLCPLQIDIVDRLITRYSNRGDWIYDPFGGLGTVVLQAMKLGRKGRSSELNNGYFLDSVHYVQAYDKQRKPAPTLFGAFEKEKEKISA